MFPREATDSVEVEVTMPESMRNFYNLKKNNKGLVRIHNPLYAYEFQSGTENKIKVSKEASLGSPGL